MVWYEKHTGISFQIFFHSNIIQPMSVSWVSRERCKEVQENFMGANTTSSDSEDGGTTEIDAPKIKKPKTAREKIGNDLDDIDIAAPGFQI